MRRSIWMALVCLIVVCLLAAEQAAAQAVVRTTSRASIERETVDPNDPIERFALLTAGGPVIVQVALTIDGEPFRVGREKLIAEMIAGADTDKDGKATWTEAFSTARFTFGRLANLNDQIRGSLIRGLDRNANGLVEAPEARQFLAQYFQGPTFSLGGGSAAFRVLIAGTLQPAPDGKADVLKLLDTDSNKSLDAGEIAAAAIRLKSRDADDNDVLDAAEISGAPTGNLVRVASTFGPAQSVSGTVLLGPTATGGAVQGVLAQTYKTGGGRLKTGCFPQFAELFTALDKNQNGQIETNEALGLNEVPPHIELVVDLAAKKPGAGLQVVAVSSQFQSGTVGEKLERILEFPGVRISLAASSAAPRMANYDSLGKSLLRQYDKDGNGYLDKTELPPLPGQFELYDDDGDGKAFPAEIARGYARQAAAQTTQVAANIVRQSNSLFEALDTNGDGRLGLREVRAAAQRLTSLDKNQDQSISGDELPESFSVSFALGAAATPADRPAIVTTAGPRLAVASGPQWFVRMDRNADGDVTLKEFLGSEDDFLRMDSSGDGLLDAQEAKAAGK